MFYLGAFFGTDHEYPSLVYPRDRTYHEYPLLVYPRDKTDHEYPSLVYPRDRTSLIISFLKKLKKLI